MRCVKKEDLKLGLDEQVLENLGSHDPQQVPFLYPKVMGTYVKRNTVSIASLFMTAN